LLFSTFTDYENSERYYSSILKHVLEADFWGNWGWQSQSADPSFERTVRMESFWHGFDGQGSRGECVFNRGAGRNPKLRQSSLLRIGEDSSDQIRREKYPLQVLEVTERVR